MSDYYGTQGGGSNICNNCGKVGHLFQQCKLPINSYGIIAFCNGPKFIMIRRKDSFGYIDFVRGKYSPYNLTQLQKIIDEMSVEEKERLMSYEGVATITATRRQTLECAFDGLWRNMWGDTNITPSKIDKQYKSEEDSSFKKYETIVNGVQIGDQIITLKHLVENSTTRWGETEWEFPKGRRNSPKERELDCALREFEEETGIPATRLQVIENVVPYEETFIGTNHKSYKHKYFLAYINEGDIGGHEYQKNEVSKIDCKTLEECLKSIRPYNLEKKQIIQSIHDVICHYGFYREAAAPSHLYHGGEAASN